MQPVVVGAADRRVQLRVARVHGVEPEGGKRDGDVDAIGVHRPEPRLGPHDVLGPEASVGVGLVPDLRKSRKALALALGLRIEAPLHRDADVAVVVPDEPGRLCAERALEVALPEVVRLQQVSVAVDYAAVLHDGILPGMDARELVLSSSRIR